MKLSLSHTPLRPVPLTRLAVTLAIGASALLGLLTAGSAAARVERTAAGSHAGKLAYPHAYTLTNTKIGHWAVVVRNVAAHALPNKNSKVLTTLNLVSSDGTQNLVLILNGLDVSSDKTWYRVRLPILPNNSTGWVQASALGTLYTVDTHLYVNRETQTLTLQRDGHTIFTTRVGVGKIAPGWGPTPRGQFYIRDKLTNFNNSFYGPVAFGTSARSSVLTDWPGGGFIGVHGTNQPFLIPGYISHGCIRLKNDAIMKLAHLMKVGTPLTVT
jgi:hypothetical protein